jgi:hypothetical protein
MRLPQPSTTCAGPAGVITEGARRERPRRSRATETPPPDDPTPSSTKRYTCDDCGAGPFVTPQAVGSHRRYTHGAGLKKQADQAPAPKPKAKPKRATENAARVPRKARPKLDTRTVRRALAREDDYDPWLLVVGRLDADHAKATTCVLSTENDARQVAELLDTLGHKPHVFRLADGR